MNLNNHQSNNNNYRLPPISIMDDFLPTKSWIPPILSSPDTSSSSLTSKLSSLPTTPQPTAAAADQWKSPPYKNTNELSRDTSYIYYNKAKTSPLLLSSTSPILTSPQQQSSQSPTQQQQRLKSPSYFQYNNNTTSTTKTTYDTKSASPSPSYTSSTYTPSRINNDIEEVVRQCNILSDNMIQRKSQFVNSYSNSSTYQELTSTQPWLDDMIGRANEVLNALLRLRKYQIVSEQYRSAAAAAATTTAAASNTSDQYQNEYINNEYRHSNTWRIGSSSTTHNTANNNNDNNSNTIRQRKRGKRPAFRGRCHSCNIENTPEWRRGPDGARTLCNACGLHYAKLARKQQENRSMSSSNAGVLGSSSSLSPTRRLSNSGFNNTTTRSPPIIDEIILD